MTKCVDEFLSFFLFRLCQMMSTKAWSTECWPIHAKSREFLLRFFSTRAIERGCWVHYQSWYRWRNRQPTGSLSTRSSYRSSSLGSWMASLWEITLGCEYFIPCKGILLTHGYFCASILESFDKWKEKLDYCICVSIYFVGRSWPNMSKFNDRVLSVHKFFQFLLTMNCQVIWTKAIIFRTKKIKFVEEN